MGISVILLAYKEENKEKVEALAWERCAVWLRMFSVYSVCYCFIRKVS